ncbi:MAG TPA: sugar transferase [Solirubrobacterales bacterium]|jgi:exopolysaccharide biosynthesis polyprenyl glycosylphosphotransferase|nr:sugar transferase [Solirubrobacterales bacterium]
MESSTATQSARRVAAAETGPAAAQAARPARRRGMVLARMLMIGDLIAAAIAAAIAVVVLGDVTPTGAAFVVIAAMLWPLTAFSIGLYRSDQLSTWASAVTEIPRGFVAIMLLTWPLFAVAALLDLGPVVALTFVTIGGTAVCSGASRTFVRASLHRRPGLQQRTLILGSGVVAGELVKKLRNNHQFGIVPVGIVDDDVHHIGTPDLPLLGSFSHLKEVIETQEIDRVIIAFSRASHEQLLESIRACRDAGVAIDVVPRLFEFLDGVRALDQVGGLPLLSIGAPVLSSASVAAKRVLDVCGSLFLIAFFSPVMIAIAIAIKLESKGPVFFRQPRSGRNNTSFRLIKFRSMYVDAEQRKQELDELNEAEDGVMFKIRDDPRVTRVGHFIRRFSLDELPQLFNVLTGQMSLVGPRPLIFPETAALEENWHLRRLELRPGLTGPWQVYGRSQSPFQEMVRFDYQYVAGWSLARDVELLFATIPAVLSGRGAY